MTTMQDRKRFEESVEFAVDFIGKQIDEYLADDEKREPLVLRDTELAPIIHSVADKYPYRKIEEAQAAIAILNAAAFTLETDLRARGFEVPIYQGTICDFTYNIASGYWYRENVHWFSLDPTFVIDVK